MGTQEKKWTWKTRFSIWFISKLYLFLIYSIGYSCRKKFVGLELVDELKQKEKNWIFAAWHNNVATASWLLRRQNGTVLVSASKDGEAIACAVNAMGIGTVRGSTSKGGGRALIEMVKVVRGGRIGLITPDGPRGPKEVLQSGVILLAQKTGAPIFPYHVEATRQWAFKKSWDQHKIPKPFSTIVVRVGEPCYVPPSLNKEGVEKIRQDFEKVMLDNVIETRKLIQSFK